MTRPPAPGGDTPPAPTTSPHKAQLLCQLLGFSDTELDLLLHLCEKAREEDPPGPEEDADPPLLGLHQLADAYPETTVAALVANRAIRLPVGVSRSSVTTLAAELRLSVRVRDILARLADRCELATRATAETLDRLALWAAPQIRVALAVAPAERDERDEFAPLLIYHERRCQVGGGVLSVRAARDATIGRGTFALRPQRLSAVPPVRSR